ncbi:MAG: polysaccharide pyruvyl transferase family protein [Lachnospiraceae bacterium]|nr:polysaccharide pyruvyl transferase family protein [Lachnospiraceae bacterium]
MTMIKVNDVSMRFVMANDKISSIKEFVTATLSHKLKFKEFWALHDVNFEVNKGEVVGIIGRNGAGKSTILKIISGILKPTTGSVERGGNVVPMLELGSGFDYDLSGRENIFLNGAILGYSQKFLEEKYDEILEFSELGDFINMPIRNYSSGMLMRLAFSIATVVQPEILIVDEILAVGDENFQKKSKKRMMELMSGGTTVLFVSHNMDQIKEMCDRVVWLDQGTVRMFGPTAEVCAAYDISTPDVNRIKFAEKDEWVEKLLEKLKKNDRLINRLGKHNIFLLGTEDYGNLGDHQIAASEHQWIKDVFGDSYRVIEIPARKYWRIKRYLKEFMHSDDIILGHGGGNLGNQYPASEEIRRDFIRSFPDNRIIIMPQTMYFTEDEAGARQLEESRRIYNAHKHLTILARERTSYEHAKEAFDCDVFLVPDIVLYSDYSDRKKDRQNITICMRSDIEAVLSKDERDTINKVASSVGGEIVLTDTQQEEYIDIEDRKANLDRFFDKICASKLVITDRLHGMVFCAITGTPCVAFSNYNHKVAGTYDWIKHLPYIRFINEVSELEGAVKDVLSAKSLEFDNTRIKEEYAGLKKKLGR